jgi:hypothetical protein
MVLLASQYDQSRFLKAADLATEKKFKIRNVTEEAVGMGKDKELKLVTWFTNDKRGLVLNRVNNRVIRTAFGDAVDGWTGKIIVIYPTVAEFRGEVKPCLRVKLLPPQPPPPKPEPAPKPATDADLSDDVSDISSGEFGSHDEEDF